MSIGKSSIARAASTTAPAVKKEPAKKPEANTLNLEIDLIKAVKGYSLKSKAGEELVLSIKKKGIILPIFVASTKDGKFYLLDGALRLDAAKTLKKKTVPVLLTFVEDEAEARAIYKEFKATAKTLQAEKPQTEKAEPQKTETPKSQKEKTATKERAVREVPVYLL